MRSPRLVFLLATLAAAAYAPFLAFPFIAISFIEIPVSRLLGTMAGFHALVTNANWHFRITYALLNSLVERWFGIDPKAFYITSLVLHGLCVLLIYGLIRWRKLPASTALWAAGFFAVYQGHHGAVTLLSSWPDLLTGVFACASLFFWVGWLQAGRKWSYVLALLFYLIAIVSNEPGFIAILLLLLPLASGTEAKKNRLLSLIPFVVLALAALVVQLVFRAKPVPWNNAVPVLDPWWITAAWACGALIVIAITRQWESRRLIICCVAWLVAAYLADLYATYGLGSPTGAVYLGSIGLALLVGIAFSQVIAQFRARFAAALALAVVAGNIALLWTVSRHQLLGLAAPTRALINAAAFAQGPIELTCFPYPFEVAQAAAGWLGGEVAPPKEGEQIRKPHCVSFRYKDSAGNVRRVFLHSAI
jgi:hypothetical protein